MDRTSAKSRGRGMRILLVCTATKGGGAAHATRRLFDTLKSMGAEVRILSLIGEGKGGEDVEASREGEMSLGASPIRRFRGVLNKALERLEILIYKRGKCSGIWRLSTARFGFDLSHHPWVGWADVIHLHWINHGLLSLGTLEALGRLGKPIVYTLHDLWASSGLCHLPFLFSEGGASLCPRYTEGCGACPLLNSLRSEDASARYVRKKLFLRSPAYHFITVSSGEADYFASSYLLGAYKQAHVIPPPLDLSSYAVIAQTSQPSHGPRWRHPDRVYVLLSAARLDDVVKGASFLREILGHFVRISPNLADKVSLVLAGLVVDGTLFEGLPIEVIRLGVIPSQEEMASVYAHVSLTISTSLFETFGQTLTESLASGVPVVSFRSCGPEDIIKDGENGYLVDCYDTKSYARAMVKALEDVVGGRWSRERIRESVRSFDAEAIAEAHLQLYASLLEGGSL